jgi:hypothetical protein
MHIPRRNRRGLARNQTTVEFDEKSRTRMSDSIEIRSRAPRCSQSWRQPLVAYLAMITAIALTELPTATAQSGSVGPAGSSVNQPSGLAPGERVLVLRTGRVMKGRIKKISTGWLVSTNRGNAVIPFEQVHFDSDDLSDAYLRLRIQNGRPTVASHLRLAEWCLSQNILAEAARELRDALEKDPSNETARLMLNRVDNEIRRRTPQEPEAQEPTDVVILTERTVEVAATEVRSLAGLSPDSAREFVASIQPLLLNKCGNARCHGTAAKNDFKLTRLRTGASNSRIVSERNLAAVLNNLQPKPNSRPRLLKIIRGTHVGKTIFNGRYGAVQMQTLQAWMNNAAKELSIELGSTQQTAFSNRSPASTLPPSTDGDSQLARSTARGQIENGPSGVIAASGTTSAGNDSAVVQASARQAGIPNLPLRNTSESPSDAVSSPTPLSNVQRLLQEARQHVRKQDAFDPEDFNRRFAGSRTR